MNNIRTEIENEITKLRLKVGADTILRHWEKARNQSCFKPDYIEALEFALDLLGMDWRAIRDAEKEAK